MALDNIALLKCYLSKLPQSLPELPVDVPAQQLLNFSYDKAWVEDVGVPGAVNCTCALEGAPNDYLPRNDKGAFFLKHRGPAIEALATVLECYLKDYPEDFLLLNWIEDSTNSVEAIFKHHNVAVSSPINSLYL